MPNHIHGVINIIGEGDNKKGVIHNALKTTNKIEIWHRNFYERIIRSEIELNNVRQYIIDNPKKWA